MPKTNTAPQPMTRSHMRDGYIIAQALAVAASTIEARPHPFKEVSNAADMRTILNTMFPQYVGLFAQQEMYMQRILKGEDPKAAMEAVYGVPVDLKTVK